MSSALAQVPRAVEPIADEAMWRLIAQGDLKGLNDGQKSKYYLHLCESMGLNPATQPFEYMTINGKYVLYAKKGATDQLRKINGVSVVKVDNLSTNDYASYGVTVQDREGRMDYEIGSVFWAGLKGPDRANADMKALTKAKRRATLSICGLGMLDETEVETIPNAHRVEMSVEANSLSPEEQAIAKANAKPNPNPMCTQDHLDTISQLCRELGMDMADKRQVMNELGITVRENKMRMADAQKLTVHLLRKCVEKHLAAKGITLDDVKNHIRIAADMPEDLDEEQAGAALGVLRSWDKLGVPA